MQTLILVFRFSLYIIIQSRLQQPIMEIDEASVKAFLGTIIIISLECTILNRHGSTAAVVTPVSHPHRERESWEKGGAGAGKLLYVRGYEDRLAILK